MLILACTDAAVLAGQAVTACASGNQVWTDAYIIPATAQATIDLLLTGGFDEGSFEVGFMGLVLLWVTGLGIGFVISHIRRTRI